MHDSETIKKWLTSVPYKHLAAEVGRRNNDKRRVHGGGRPKVLRPCPKCGVQFGARELASHHCPVKRKAKKKT
jgi:hypothetical protein